MNNPWAWSKGPMFECPQCGNDLAITTHKMDCTWSSDRCTFPACDCGLEENYRHECRKGEKYGRF